MWSLGNWWSLFFLMLLHDLVSRIRIEGKGATVMAFSSRLYSEAEAQVGCVTV